MADYSDLYNRTKETNCLVAQTLSADTNCAPVDLGEGKPHERAYKKALFLISVGVDAALDGSNYWEIEMEDSDDDSTYADVTEASYVTGNVEDLTGGLCFTIDATTEDDVVIAVQYSGPKRYVRIVMNETGTLTTPVAVVGLAAGARYKPI